MMFLDSNILLRHLTLGAGPASRRMSKQATGLFEKAERSEIEITTSEVVLHEVIYVLASKHHYGMTPETVAETLRPLLSMKGFRLPRGDRAVYNRALDLFVEHPRLGFADSVIAARALQRDLVLATFDKHFDRIPEIRRWSADE